MTSTETILDAALTTWPAKVEKQTENGIDYLDVLRNISARHCS